MAGNNHAEEWDQAIKQTDKFDGYLIDLRKYGFTLVTGLITASSFLGFQAVVQQVQIGVVFVTIVLVIVLYWLDIYYQNLLNGAALRARVLEIFHLDRQLSIYISDTYNKNGLSTFLALIYGGFIAALLILGIVVMNSATEQQDIDIKLIADAAYQFAYAQSERGAIFGTNEIPFLMLILIGGSVAGFAAIGFLHSVERKRRKKIDDILAFIATNEKVVRAKRKEEVQKRERIQILRKNKDIFKRKFDQLSHIPKSYEQKERNQSDLKILKEIDDEAKRLGGQIAEMATRERNLTVEADKIAQEIENLEDQIINKLQK
ncbi:hypothetical protein [Candidatus Nitrososphaera sp. FF02]|uniref:hypothetical protein n=1 Tax=Candidatus Nitrososphaera sp. FF02 TaxID=3398226 RepID=UPI0039E924DA